MRSWTRRLAGGLALALLTTPSALRAASALTPRNRTPILRVASAEFHRGRLAKGGPVVYRNSGSGGSGEEPGGEKAPGDLPSVGVFAGLPSSYRLESLEVTATPRGETGALDVLVDREIHGDPIELTRDGPGTHTVDLTAVPGGGTRRIEVRVGAASGDVTVSALKVTARKLERGVAQASGDRALPDARDAREFLPFDPETVWRYEDPDDEERFDVAVVGVESYGGRDLLRIEDGGSDSWQLMDVREGRWLVVHKSEGKPLRDFDRRPLPWFPSDATIPGDRYEALFRRTVTNQPPELRWNVEVEEGGRVSVAAGTYTSVLRLRVIGDDLQQGRRSTEATLDLAEGVGVVRARGKLFDHRLDRDLYELQPGEPLHPDPDPEPRDPDPEPDPEPEPPGPPGPPGKQTDDPRVRALVDQWLTAKGLDGWGRKVGPAKGGFIKANYEPDGATGMSRHEWVWIHFWKDGLNSFVQRGLRGGGGSGDVGGR